MRYPSCATIGKPPASGYGAVFQYGFCTGGADVGTANTTAQDAVVAELREVTRLGHERGLVYSGSMVLAGSTYPPRTRRHPIDLEGA